MDTIDRFMGFVAPEPNTGCYLWMGELNSRGRPRFNAVCRSKVRRRIRVSATRWILETKVGPIPPGHHVHHKCETPLCVNPDHLEVVEAKKHNAEHSRGDGFCPNGHEYAVHGYYRETGQLVYCRICQRERKNKTGAPAPAKRTHCPKGHPYEGDNLYISPQGKRFCRECRRQNDRAAYRRALHAAR